MIFITPAGPARKPAEAPHPNAALRAALAARILDELQPTIAEIVHGLDPLIRSRLADIIGAMLAPHREPTTAAPAVRGPRRKA